MRNYLYILQIYGAGNPKIHNVLNYYGTAENAVKKIMQGDKSKLPPKRELAASAASLERSDKIIAWCAKNNIRIITIDDDDYPDILRNIYNPPTVLFVQGDLSYLDNRVSVAAVGPRMPDRYAARLASVICPGLAKCGMVLVSGLARGIDQTAHISSVRAHQPTIAVLACGSDVEYPANTMRLRRDIIKSGGAVVTELLPGTGCNAGYFEYRNRLISGLADGTLVIGANNTSGSMITARHAAEQDRDLFFTVPPDTLSPKVSRVIKYLRDGAIPVYDHYDVIGEYFDIYGDRLNAKYIDKNRLGYLARGGRMFSEVDIAKPQTAPDIAPPPDEPDIPPAPAHPESRNYVDMMPKKYRILLGYEKPDDSETEEEKPDIQDEPPLPTEAELRGQGGTPADSPRGIVLGESDSPLRQKLYRLIESSESGISLDEILRNIDDDFGDVTETLADMEIDGAIKCGVGNVFVATSNT
ncbi:MAG: DNA-protecting protein DprA [Eubacterium sp.]|nr:DNA-protecting protein DprA [Eubacterium sp.]